MLYDVTVIDGSLDEYYDSYGNSVSYAGLSAEEAITVCRLSLSQGLSCYVQPASDSTDSEGDT